MNKSVAAFFMVSVVAFLSLGFTSSAQAYDDPTRNVQDAPQVVSQADTDSSQAAASASTATSSPLPGTGGPNEALLIGGAGLLVAGGAAVVTARRRRTS